MGLFKKKGKKPDSTSMAGQRGNAFVAPPQSNDPSLPGNAGWCGGAKTGSPLRFSYVRPDGKPDRKRGFWTEDES